MIKDLLQTTLDDVLYAKNIYVYEQRKTGADADQYVVYRMSGDVPENYGDDRVMSKSAKVTVLYFYRTDLLDNHDTRQQVREIENTIEDALEDAGFTIPFGRFDAGDVDDIGFFATVYECEYWRMI